jgi:protein-tyrosine phosphatase
MRPALHVIEVVIHCGGGIGRPSLLAARCCAQHAWLPRFAVLESHRPVRGDTRTGYAE